jgi:aspartyl protease family protein
MLRLLLQICVIGFVLAVIGPDTLVASLQAALDRVAEAKWPPVLPLSREDDASPPAAFPPASPGHDRARLWSRTVPQAKALGPGRVEVGADRSGHYRTQAQINGRNIPVIVDTGATEVALSYEAAAELGIKLQPADYTRIAQTVGGIMRVAPVRLREVRIGDVSVRNVSASVSMPGAQKMESLLGMTFLSKLSRIEIASGRLSLTQ